MRVKIETPLITGIVLAGIFFFIFVSLPVFNGDSNFRFYADSLFYMDFSQKIDQYLEKGYYLVGMGGNLLGPYLLYELVHGNVVAILILNTLILILFCKKFILLSSSSGILFTIFFFVSPITFLSMQAVNKEVIALLSLLAFFYYKEKGLLLLLPISLLLAFLARWQMVFVLLIFTAMYSNTNPFRNNLKIQIFIVVLAASILYPLASGLFIQVNDAINAVKDEIGGKGSYFFLLSLQDKTFGYMIAYPLKLIHLLYGMAANVDFMFRLDDFYITTGLFYQAIINLLVSLVLIFRLIKKPWLIRTPAFYFFVVYSVIFCLTPIYNLRYLYPIYPIIMMLAFTRHNIVNSSRFWFKI